MLPAQDPRYVVAIMLDAPQGGTSAAPLFHDIGSYLAQREKLPVSPDPQPIQTLVSHAPPAAPAAPAAGAWQRGARGPSTARSPPPARRPDLRYPCRRVTDPPDSHSPLDAHPRRRDPANLRRAVARFRVGESSVHARRRVVGAGRMRGCGAAVGRDHGRR